MNESLIRHIQIKIKSLKNEISSIEYTSKIDKIPSKNDTQKILECTHKIQVLNEVIISFGIQEKSKK